MESDRRTGQYRHGWTVYSWCAVTMARPYTSSTGRFLLQIVVCGNLPEEDTRRKERDGKREEEVQ